MVAPTFLWGKDTLTDSGMGKYSTKRDSAPSYQCVDNKDVRCDAVYVYPQCLRQVYCLPSGSS